MYKLAEAENEVKTPGAKQVSENNAKPWTEQESLLLVEGMEMFRDDWNKIADHVGSRTQQECISQFLRIPIEDPFFESGPQTVPTKNSPIPFSSSGNPLIIFIKNPNDQF